MVDIQALTMIAEGKTKAIYANPDDAKTVYMHFKDDITAGDGAKHDVIEGKAVLDWRVNRDIFEYLNRVGVRTHYVNSPQERVSLVKKLDQKINLEVVTRRVATGSILDWKGETEGTRYDPLITQYHYKDDPLHDPMLDQGYIEYLIRSKGATEYAEMVELNADTFVQLERAFANCNIQLVDMKLEYGLIDSKVHLIDEISGGSFRLWPYKHENPNLDQANVLAELDPEGRLDKDTYRMGQQLDAVLSKFGAIADITAGFRDLRV